MNNTSGFEAIRAGSRVTILIPCGLGRDGQEYKQVSGRAVMRGPAGWVINIGGKHGTPKIASPENTLRVRQPHRSPMQAAAEACGLVRVRVNGKTFYE